MPHGHPDYGAAAPATTIYTIQDMAELAARLGSIVTFDRRGNVIWFDDFEGSLNKWNHSSTGNAGDFQHSAEAARSGSFSAKLITPPTTDHDIWIFGSHPLPTQSKIGLELSYSMLTQIKYLYLVLEFYEVSATYYFALRFDRYNTTLAYQNSSGGYTDLAGEIAHPRFYHAWNTIKLVADYENKKYVRALLNENSFDLSDIDCYRPNSWGQSYLYLKILVTNRATDQHSVYLDDVILTQNEP